MSVVRILWTHTSTYREHVRPVTPHSQRETIFWTTLTLTVGLSGRCDPSVRFGQHKDMFGKFVSPARRLQFGANAVQNCDFCLVSSGFLLIPPLLRVLCHVRDSSALVGPEAELHPQRPSLSYAAQ